MKSAFAENFPMSDFVFLPLIWFILKLLVFFVMNVCHVLYSEQGLKFSLRTNY